MTLSAIRKLIFPSIITSSIVFAAMTLPLAMMGDNQIRIKVQEESFFHGRLRDVAAPYVVFATLVSLGTGISIMALGGLHHSGRKSLDYQNKLSRLEKDLQQKEELLKELKLSDSSLKASGLNSFLNEQITTKDVQEVEKFSTVVSQPVFAENYIAVSKPLVQQAESNFIAVENPNPSKNEKSDINFEVNNNAIPEVKESELKETAVFTQTSKTNVARSEFEELQLQLQNLMARMQQLQMKVEPVD